MNRFIIEYINSINKFDFYLINKYLKMQTNISKIYATYNNIFMSDSNKYRNIFIL